MKLLKFSAPWCGQCRVLAKQLEKFDVCEVVEYDVEEDENEHLIDEYKIKNLPMLIFVNDDDSEIKRWHGTISNIDEFKNEIKSLIK